MLAFFVHQMEEQSKRLKCYLFYASMMIVSLLIMKFFQLFQTNAAPHLPLFYPAAFAPLVLNFFMNRRSGLLMHFSSILHCLYLVIRMQM